MNRVIQFQRKLSTGSSPIHADVCIVGGGIVGTALATGIGMSAYAKGRKIVLIEGGDLLQSNQVVPGRFSNRVSSITPKSSSFLKELQAWEKIQQDRRWTYRKMHVWDASSDGQIQFGNGSDLVATIVENRLLQQSLAERMQELDNVVLYNKTRVRNIRRLDDDSPMLEFDDGTTISCDLLVGADGPMSKVREFAEVDIDSLDYRQSGLVGTVQVEESENTTAWQRFLPSGPVALLPLSRNESSIVWTLDSKIAPSVAKLAPEAFVALLNAAFTNPKEDIAYLLSQITLDGSALVDFEEESEWGRSRVNMPTESRTPLVLGVHEGSRACFPLRLRHAKEYCGNRVVLVGDAAHVIHPLAGQGLNLGLADADSLSMCIANAFRDGQDIGHKHSIEQYSKNRFMANASMLVACDAVNRVFSNDSELLATVRSIGMNSINLASPIKGLFMKFAS